MSDTPKRCGVSDGIRLVLPAGVRPWPKDRLTYRIDAYLDGLPPATQDDIHRAAFRSWSEVTPLRFTQVPARQPADILLSAGRGRRAGFDGPSGVLAWMELPNGSGRPVQGLFDLDESWSNDPNRDIYLLAVSAHELGHALGLDHDTARDVALMDPTYNRRIARPQPADVRRIQAFFGGPAGPVPPPFPPPSPPSPPTPNGGLMDWLKGVRAFVQQMYSVAKFLPGTQPDAALKMILDVIDLILAIPGVDQMSEGQLRTLLAQKLQQ